MTQPDGAEPIETSPRRLVDGTDGTARLLRGALGAPMPTSSLTLGALLQVRRQRAWRKRALSTLAAACVPLGVLWWWERPVNVVPIAPELVAESPSPPVFAERKAERSSRPEDDAVPVPPADAVLQRDAHPPEPRTSGKRATVTPVTRSTESADVLDPSPRHAPEERCSDSTSRGEYRGAIACYERKAAAGGVAAEWALLEKARIQNLALQSPAEALATLDEYAARFPGGALSREAQLARIELLVTVGRGADALVAIDDALGGNRVPERAGELVLLRAQLRAAAGDCAAARVDVEEARSRGVPQARVQAVLDRCEP